MRNARGSPYILAVTGKGGIGDADAKRLARVFDTFVLIYHKHTTPEDTVVFSGRKDALSERRLREKRDSFKKTEHHTFGQDAVGQIAPVEQSLGFAELAQSAAAGPPKA